MTDLQATFALLQPPSFDVLPDTDVRLGSIHPRTKTKPRRPDTRRILNRSSRVPVPKELYRPRIDPILILDSEKLKGGGGSIGLNLPILQGVGGGVAEERVEETIMFIRAENVETQWFQPDDAYFTEAIKGVEVRRELWDIRTPSVFMVTGVKIAETATIVSGRQKSRKDELGPELDLTALGVPVEVNAKINAQRQDYHITAVRKSSKFVLAFETRRMKKKQAGYTERNFDNFALLDDEPHSASMDLANLLEQLSLNEVRTEVDDE
jgi:hypothetical protein